MIPDESDDEEELGEDVDYQSSLKAQVIKVSRKPTQPVKTPDKKTKGTKRDRFVSSVSSNSFVGRSKSPAETQEDEIYGRS